MTDPAELLKQLSANADPRKVKSLKIIHDVCEEQRRHGSFDFSLAAIGRLSSEKGGPAAGAIRNTTGEAYRALIKSHLDAAGGKKPKGKPHKADENPFDGITDPVLRARIGILMAENESLRAQLQAARHLASQISEVNVCREYQPEDASNKPSFTAQEISTVSKILDSKAMAKKGLLFDEKGQMMTEEGKVLLGHGFRQFLEKSLATQSEKRDGK